MRFSEILQIDFYKCGKEAYEKSRRMEQIF